MSKPSVATLPDQPAVFTVRLSSEGDSSDFDLSMDRRDTARGLVVLANGDTLATNQHYENITEEFDIDIEVYRGPVHYDYPPVELRLQSRCDSNKVANATLYTHTLDSGERVIRFARECPKLVLDGSLGTGFVVVNGDMEKKVDLVVQNVEKSTRGTLAEMAANPDDTFNHTHIKWRRIGSHDWLNVMVSDTESSDNGALVAMDLALSYEDDYGFVFDTWDLDAYSDGDYEVMIESFCEEAPSEFRKRETATSIVRLDTIPPEPYAFPVETDLYHVGEPLIFEYDEALDCSPPVSFFVDVIVYTEDDDGKVISRRYFDSHIRNNLLIVCEDRMIGVQFDSTMYNLDNLLGKRTKITLSNVADSSGNLGDDQRVFVYFSSELESDKGRRRLTEVPSIKVFQKNSESTKAAAGLASLDEKFASLQFEMETGREKLDSLQLEMEAGREKLDSLQLEMMYLCILIVVLIILMVGLISLLLLKKNNVGTLAYE